jgi:hypothetical protein
MTRKNKPLASPSRPMPPAALFESMGRDFMPAPDVMAWARSMILAEDAPLYNPDHQHLAFADIAVLWAAGGFVKQGRTVLGQCEEVTFRCGPWQKGRQEQQMQEWFGSVPDFLITLDASFCANCSDAEFCALVEHELFHIGHALDEYGALAFTKAGAPKLRMRAHDVSEFVGIVKRYGVGSPDGDVARLVAAANAGPQLRGVTIAQACGTCLLRAA